MKKRLFALLMAAVLLLSALPFAWAKTDATFQLPLSIRVDQTIAGVELKLRFTEGVTFKKWVKSNALKGASYIDNTFKLNEDSNSNFDETGILKIAYYTNTNKYSPTNGIMDLGYLEFEGTPSGQALEFLSAKITIVVSQTQVDSIEGLPGLIVDLSRFTGSFPEIPREGTCGDNLTWVLKDDGTLVITGTGAMTAFSTQVSVPWSAYASEIKAVSLPDGLTSIGPYAFFNCAGLTAVDIPDKVTSIGNSAFYGTALTSLILPEGMTSVGSSAFGACKSLKEVTVPKTMSTIGGSAFSGCTALKDVYYNGTPTDWNKISISSGNAPLTDAARHYPDGILAGGTCGANLQWTLSEDGVLSITGSGKMYDYSSAVSNRAPWYGYRSMIRTVSVAQGATSVGDYAFYNCISLTSVNLPTGLTSLGTNAFGNCSSLNPVSIPATVTVMEDNVFFGCKKLTDLTLPTGLSSLGRFAFSGCSALTSITIPEGITALGLDTFYNCAALTTVRLSKTLTSVGEGAFSGCARLQNVYYSGTDADWDKVQIDSDNAPLLNAALHTACATADIKTACTDNGDGTHTVTTTCSLCDKVYETETVICADEDHDGRCDDCGAVVKAEEEKPAYELLSLQLVDGSGTVMTALSNGKFYVEAEVMKNLEAEPVVAMIVLYTADGQLLDTVFVRANVPAGSTYSLGTWLDNTDGKIGEVKVLLVSALGNPAPVCEAISIR